mmetsp:Transcript_120815/g.337123  ORF Transcript_120815/g.337123 Transcript_120815/m.337123 type:complete len:231 (-) Transcript_120815:22-714(-)
MLLQPLHVVGHLQVLVPLLLGAQHVVRLGDTLVELVVLVGRRSIRDLVRMVPQSQVPHLLPQEPEIVLLRKVHFLQCLLDLLVLLLDLAAQDIDADLVVLAGEVLGQLLALALPAGLKHLAALRDLLRQLLRLLEGLGLALLFGNASADLALHLPESLVALLTPAPQLPPGLRAGLVALALLLRFPARALEPALHGLLGALELRVVLELLQLAASRQKRVHGAAEAKVCF